MERPQLYFFILPLSGITLILYLKVLHILWLRFTSCDNLFYKLVRTQAIFDISYVILYFVFEAPQDWPGFQEYLLRLNDTPWVQVAYAHRYTTVNGQILGVTLNSIGRMIIVRYPANYISKKFDQISTLKVVVIHLTPPILFGLYVFFGQTSSRFEFVPSLNRMTRVTDVEFVRINSMVSMITSVSGALISALCYIMILITLKKRPYRSWNIEASILITSFMLFLCLCTLTVYFLANGLFSMFDWDAMYMVRLHYYAFSFPISLISPWSLLLTSAEMRQYVLGKSLSRMAAILSSRTTKKQASIGSR